MIGELKRYNSIGRVESAAAHAAVHGEALSGFLGGELRGGRWVRELEDKWAETFGVRHAIACNSATSGLLAACAAVGVEGGSDVVVPAMTMSATAAAPRMLGARIHFADVEAQTFTLDKMPVLPAAVIITNLFGHPGHVESYRAVADHNRRFCWKPFYVIEDNAQAPFAKEGNKYTGTIGHIGVFSLNVHKHIQSGEGGICITDDGHLANAMRHFINHGEMAGGLSVGLNLRMTEVTAAIAFAQLSRGPQLVQQRVEIAESLLSQIGDIPGLRLPATRNGCRHVFYTVPFIIDERRTEFVASMGELGVPLVEGYVNPLYRLPAFQHYATECPTAARLHDWQLFYYENCAWDPTPHQVRFMADAFHKVAERMKL